ncbi:uncharacterized protein LDX57_004342 [Aspergillus melleus]|uniref:uncharacterized protein n=1 Tax=Aspergillus melleus TaxID=138277 RepID=UPI001E8D0177|nr:uncharacterized protein LDX57_004342 [Aspergillus melleus]KAH8426607.1 hypothetical protein LDX57_004342 [Aspergillus melleus]
MIPDCLKRPGLLGTQHVLTNHLYLKRNICLQDYQMWAESFLCTFLGGSHILQDVHRGPFMSSSDWITSRLSLCEKDCQSVLDNLPFSDLESDDEDDADDARRTLEIIGKLKTLLPSFFPPNGDNPETSVLVHDDLSSRNILVHENGELAAILDWECVSALPLWNACYYPAFLKGHREASSLIYADINSKRVEKLPISTGNTYGSMRLLSFVMCLLIE